MSNGLILIYYNFTQTNDEIKPKQDTEHLISLLLKAH